MVQDSKRREVYIILIFKSLAGSWKTLLLSLEHLIKGLKTEETTTIYMLPILPVHVQLCVDLIIKGSLDAKLPSYELLKMLKVIDS